MNNLFQQLMSQSHQSQGSLPSRNNEFLKSLLSSSNPEELLNNLISSNPKLQSVMQLMRSSGMTPKQFFYDYAQQQGINPDEFLRKEFENNG
jgi:hypothetical protein